MLQSLNYDRLLVLAGRNKQQVIGQAFHKTTSLFSGQWSRR